MSGIVIPHAALVEALTKVVSDKADALELESIKLLTAAEAPRC